MRFEHFYDVFQKDIQYEALLKPILPYLHPNETLLDAGCGTGYILELLLKKNYQAIGLDVSPFMLSLAYDKLQPLGFTHHLFEHDLKKPVSMQFDQIICLLDVIHYFKGCKKLFLNLYRALNPNGRLIIDLYKEPFDSFESGKVSTLAYTWKVSKQPNGIKHQIDVQNDLDKYHYHLKQYVYPMDYYVGLLQEIGFSIQEFKGFDDRKRYFVCTK